MNKVEEDGVVVYDPTDDVEEEMPKKRDDDTMELADYYLQQTPGLFSDEYMQRFAEKTDAEMARAKRIDRLVSLGVIVGIVLFIALLCWIFF